MVSYYRYKKSNNLFLKGFAFSFYIGFASLCNAQSTSNKITDSIIIARVHVLGVTDSLTIAQFKANANQLDLSDNEENTNNNSSDSPYAMQGEFKGGAQLQEMNSPVIIESSNLDGISINPSGNKSNEIKDTAKVIPLSPAPK